MKTEQADTERGCGLKSGKPISLRRPPTETRLTQVFKIKTIDAWIRFQSRFRMLEGFGIEDIFEILLFVFLFFDIHKILIIDWKCVVRED